MLLIQTGRGKTYYRRSSAGNQVRWSNEVQVNELYDTIESSPTSTWVQSRVNKSKQMTMAAKQMQKANLRALSVGVLAVCILATLHVRKW